MPKYKQNRIILGIKSNTYITIILLKIETT